VSVIPPSKQNYYFVEPNDDDEKAIILEADTDLGFILKTQIAQLNDDEPTQREAVKNLRILIIMTRKEKWKPSTVGLFHGDKQKEDVAKHTVGGMGVQN